MFDQSLSIKRLADIHMRVDVLCNDTPNIAHTRIDCIIFNKKDKLHDIHIVADPMFVIVASVIMYFSTHTE